MMVVIISAEDSVIDEVKGMAGVSLTRGSLIPLPEDSTPASGPVTPSASLLEARILPSLLPQLIQKGCQVRILYTLAGYRDQLADSPSADSPLVMDDNYI
jgi:hypothetical protein